MLYYMYHIICSKSYIILFVNMFYYITVYVLHYIMLYIILPSMYIISSILNITLYII